MRPSTQDSQLPPRSPQKSAARAETDITEIVLQQDKRRVPCTSAISWYRFPRNHIKITKSPQISGMLAEPCRTFQPSQVRVNT